MYSQDNFLSIQGCCNDFGLNRSRQYFGFAYKYSYMEEHGKLKWQWCMRLPYG